MFITTTTARFLGELPEDIEILDLCRDCGLHPQVWANDDLCVPCWERRVQITKEVMA